MTAELPDNSTLTGAVAMACRAPSLYNSQPWRWMADHGTLRLFADHSRIGEATDTSGREVILSCGAVLHHLTVAMAARGFQSSIERFPDPNQPNHLATVEFTTMSFVTDAHRRRAEAILRRHTDRLPMDEPSHWDQFETVLRSTFSQQDAILTVLTHKDRPKLAEASQLTEALRRYDSSYHAELAWWTSGVARGEGVPPGTLPTPEQNRLVGVDRDFAASDGGDPCPSDRGHQPAGLGVDRSTILVLSTADDVSTEVLRCGEALSTVLLEATMADLVTCPLTHMIEVAASRDIVAGLVGGASLPQVLVRVGRARAGDEPLATTPRRPVAEVLSFRS